MGEKSVQKKKYILGKAREVFAEKGYLTVTMKDIVDACEISRGGLYLYFADTRELFLEVLREEKKQADDIFEKELSAESSPADILAVFLKEQKKELLSKKKGLDRASYEFYFYEKEQDNDLKKQFESAVLVLRRLIEAGVEAGEFYCEDPRRAASNMMYVLEGLKISALTRGISEVTVDREIMYMMQGLVAED